MSSDDVGHQLGGSKSTSAAFRELAQDNKRHERVETDL